ncbi:MAG: hypothetical protein QOF70_3436 [Acetobacteraceae bacterium]|nr:hypothetical protein [Acetobacteraceae bacterium]
MVACIHLSRYADLAVIGAGPAGAAAAIAAARCGLRVILIGPVATSGRPVQSLPPEGIAILERLGVTDTGARVWFSGVMTPYGFRAFGQGPSGLSLGAHLDRDEMDNALCQSAIRAGATWLRTEVLGLRKETSVFKVDCGGDIQCETARVVLATGRLRRFSRGLSIRSCAMSAPLLMATGQRRVSRGEESSALLLPGSDSWLWIAPLGKGWAAWTSVARAGTPSAERLAKAGRVSAATWLLSDPASGEGWVAAGDAVCALDPSWGRGIVFALTTGEAAGLASAAALRDNDLDRQRGLELLYRNELRASVTAQAALLAISWRASSPQWAREALLGVRSHEAGAAG